MAEENQVETRFWMHPVLPDLPLFTAPPARYRHEMHDHDSFSLIVLTEGAKTLQVGRRRHSAERGQIVLVEPGDPHGCESAYDTAWAHRTWYPTQTLVATLAAEIGLDAPPSFAGPVIDDPRLVDALLHAHRTAETGDAMDQEVAAIEALCGLLAAHGVSGRKPVVATKGADRRFAAYDARIRDDITSPLDLESLAAIGGVTRFQVIRDFNRAIGMSPGTYLRARRLDVARRLILSGVPMAQAALAAGFADQAHFSRVFRAAHGITPRAFRAAMR